MDKEENKKKLVLVVDDDENFRQILVDKIKSSGFDVDQASNGEDGITKARSAMPDLVVMDVQMPGMTGIQTLAKMKEDEILSGLRVLFLTSFGTPDEEQSWLDKKYAQEMGAVGHMKKSEDLSKIIAEIKALVSPDYF